MVLKELKTKLFRDQFILYFPRLMLDEINEIRLSGDRTCYNTRMENVNSKLIRFSGLKTLNLRNSEVDYFGRSALSIPSLEKLIINGCKNSRIKILNLKD